MCVLGEISLEGWRSNYKIVVVRWEVEFINWANIYWMQALKPHKTKLWSFSEQKSVVRRCWNRGGSVPVGYVGERALSRSDRKSTQVDKAKNKTKHKEGNLKEGLAHIIGSGSRDSTVIQFCLSFPLGFIPALSFIIHIDSYQCGQLQERKMALPCDCSKGPESWVPTMAQCRREGPC